MMATEGTTLWMVKRHAYTEYRQAFVTGQRRGVFVTGRGRDSSSTVGVEASGNEKRQKVF